MRVAIDGRRIGKLCEGRKSSVADVRASSSLVKKTMMEVVLLHRRGRVHSKGSNSPGSPRPPRRLAPPRFGPPTVGDGWLAQRRVLYFAVALALPWIIS